MHSGLLAARLALGADLVVAHPGTGQPGHRAPAGASPASACGEAVNAAATLGGRPVGSLRISTADARPRHRGLSHHSLTAYGRVALLPADLAVPDFAGAGALDGIEGLAAVVALAPEVEAAAAALTRHRAVRVPLAGLDVALPAPRCGCRRMGRGLDGDPAYFLAAAAAGRHAAALVDTAPPAV